MIEADRVVVERPFGNALLGHEIGDKRVFLVDLITLRWLVWETFKTIRFTLPVW
jgi:hypothetical protein